MAVFSKGYAHSKWCLNELCDLLKCHKTQKAIILPVFYDFDPEHLRRPCDGPFKEAFEEHVKKSRSHQDIERWKVALLEAANISGFRLRQEGGYVNKSSSILITLVLCLPLDPIFDFHDDV